MTFDWLLILLILGEYQKIHISIINLCQMKKKEKI